MTDNNATFDENANEDRAEPMYKTQSVRLHELVYGLILDKRRAAVDPERLAKAVSRIDATLGASIQETKQYTVVMSSLTLEAAIEYEISMNPLHLKHNPDMGMGYMRPNGDYPLGVQAVRFAVFSDLTQPGLEIRLHPAFMQQNTGYSEGAVIQLALGLILGDHGYKGIGFGR